MHETDLRSDLQLGVLPLSTPILRLRELFKQTKDLGLRDMICWRAERYGPRFLQVWQALLDDSSLQAEDITTDEELLKMFRKCPRLRQFFRKEIEVKDYGALRRARHFLEFCTSPRVLKELCPQITDDYAEARAVGNQESVVDQIEHIRIFLSALLKGVHDYPLESVFIHVKEAIVWTSEHSFVHFPSDCDFAAHINKILSVGEKN